MLYGTGLEKIILYYGDCALEAFIQQLLSGSIFGVLIALGEFQDSILHF